MPKKDGRYKDCRSCKESSKWAQEQEIKTREEWKKAKEKADFSRDIPKDPQSYYKRNGTWNNWGDFLGTGNAKNKDCRSCEESGKWAQEQKIKTKKGWQKAPKGDNFPKDIPRDPCYQYKKEGTWISWGDFLGTKHIHIKHCRSCKESSKWTQEQGIKSQRKWKKAKEKADFPKDIPKDPQSYYKRNGTWISWYHLFGTEKEKGWTKERMDEFLESIDNLDLPEEIRYQTHRRLKRRFHYKLNKVSKSRQLKELMEKDQELSFEHKQRIKAPSTSAIVKILNNPCINELDDEFIEYLMQVFTWDMWRKVFESDKPQSIVKELKKRKRETESANIFVDKFLREYNKTKSLKLQPLKLLVNDAPKSCTPLFMQRYVVHRLSLDSCFLNLSNMGVGKTASALWSVQYFNLRNNAIICPNDIGDMWEKVISISFPDASIHRNFCKAKRGVRNFWIINYEKFQLNNSRKRFTQFLKDVRVHFLVFDEVHLGKQRYANQEEKTRRKNLMAFRSKIQKINPNVKVLGLTATPVINNLQEGKSLLELVTGKKYSDLRTRVTVDNCFALREQLVINSVRHVQNVDDYNRIFVDSNATTCIAKIKENPSDILHIESVLLDYKISGLKKHLKKGAIVYAHYKSSSIIKKLVNAVKSRGYSCCSYTGSISSKNRRKVLRDFKDGKFDILVASRPIIQGHDGLQFRCDRMIIVIPPWTDMELSQLIGRIHGRYGCNNSVDIVFLITYFIIDGERHSWDRWKLSLLAWKRSISDCAVDGRVPTIIPEEEARSALCKLLKSKISNIETIHRDDIDEEDYIVNDKPVLVRQNSEFLELQKKLNRQSSEKTDVEFQDESTIKFYLSENEKYLTSQEVDPRDEIANMCHNGNVVADFGCGNAVLAKKLKGKCKVYSFDRTKKRGIINCNMRDVSSHISDGMVDKVVFCLSLQMGTAKDKCAYLQEAYRCLKVGGEMIVVENSSNSFDIEACEKQVLGIGFSFQYDVVGNFFIMTATKLMESRRAI